MKPVVIHPEAKREMIASTLFYEERSPGLGRLFLDEVEYGFRRIAERPDAWNLLSSKVRRCLLTEFPFGIIYRNEPERIYILAVMHLRREPGYWKNRH
jgi:plasmid stabilization system protein ParE